LNFTKKIFRLAKKFEADDDKLLKINGDNTMKTNCTNENLRHITFQTSNNFNRRSKSNIQRKIRRRYINPEFAVVQWIETGLKLTKRANWQIL
jgi:hypothetical protein